MSQAERQKGVRQSLLDAPSQNVPRALVRSVSAFSPLHLSKYFSNFPFVSLVPLSLSLPPSFMLHHSLLRPCDKFSIQSRSFAGSRKRSTYPVGLTNIYKSRGEIFIISSDCKQNSYCIPSSSWKYWHRRQLWRIIWRNARIMNRVIA